METKKTGAIVDLIGSHSQDAQVQELQRLVMCYQLASRDDRNVVWAALNKYASQIDKI